MYITEMSQYELQPAENYGQVFDLFTRCWKPILQADGQPWDSQRQNEKLYRKFQENHFDLIIHNEKPVGLLSLEQKTNTIHVLQLNLIPSHQRKGIGGAIISDLKQQAKNEGKTVTLETQKYNKNAQKFYRKHKFKIVGTSESRISHKMLCKP